MNEPLRRNDGKSALENLENKIYSKTEEPETISRHKIETIKDKELPNSWSNDSIVEHPSDYNSKKGLSLGTVILIVSFLILLLSVVFTVWRISSSRNIVSSSRITMTSDISPTIEGGEPTPFVVSLQNLNEVPLEETVLTISYKQGVGSQDEQEKVLESRNLGTINAQDYKRQDFNITLYGSEGESRDITSVLNYKVSGSNAVFSKTVISTVTIKTPSLSVHIDGPTNVSLGQESTFVISIKNTTSTTSRNSLLLMTLPTNFTVVSSSPKKNDRENSWIIPELGPGETQDVTIVGVLGGVKGENATMRAVVGALGGSLSNVDVVYSSVTFDVVTQESPLDLTFDLDTLNGTKDILRYGDNARITVNYKNNKDVPLRDVSLLLMINGTAADYSGIKVDRNEGYYNSIKKTILWDKSTYRDLALVDSGSSGSFQIFVPILNKGNNSPQLSLEVLGSATILAIDDVSVKSSRTWNVQGSTNLKAETHYKNSSIPNTGPIPPQPNVDTTYTARLTVSAQNALIGTKVSFALPAYVSWKNSTSDPDNITYDSRNRTVIWSIPTIGAGQTVMSDIQLSLRASQSQINQVAQLTSAILLDTQEQVSRSIVKTTLSPLTTVINGEGYSNESFVVTP